VTVCGDEDLLALLTRAAIDSLNNLALSQMIVCHVFGMNVSMTDWTDIWHFLQTDFLLSTLQIDRIHIYMHRPFSKITQLFCSRHACKSHRLTCISNCPRHFHLSADLGCKWRAAVVIKSRIVRAAREYYGGGGGIARGKLFVWRIEYIVSRIGILVSPFGCAQGRLRKRISRGFLPAQD
jgi:hypothetical protein